MAAGALGTQTNGSVIRPAAFCGVVGFKPSFGTVSNDGTLDPWPTLDHTGVFARDVRDAALLASVIADKDRVCSQVSAPTQAPKLALVRSPVWALADRAQQDMLEENAATLARAGARVDELDLPEIFGNAHAVHRVILAYEGAHHFAPLQKQHRSDMSARFNELLDAGAAVSDNAYRAALESMRTLRLEFDRVLKAYDCVITPPASGEAPATLEETGNPAFCTLWTLLGAPAVTLPSGVGPAALPLGLQIVGPCNQDDRTLSVAAWCESQLAFSGPRLQ
jgi:Asp-tRNA(Asn)/Glu-tRNA(Gln) amidotransferase A subunit family amidase